MRSELSPNGTDRRGTGDVSVWQALAGLQRRALRWWWGAPPATFHNVSAETIVVVVWRDCGVRWMP